MPPLATQVKLMHAVREILLGDGRNALPRGNDPKPDFAPTSGMALLPRATPEDEGISSRRMDAFFRAIANIPQINAHSLLVLRHGRVIAEAYFSPFRSDIWHVTHSLCKTITGSAVGLAIEEGLFGLDDRIVDHFPKEAGLFPSKNMRAITVRHLLTMTSGISFNEISEAVETNWLRGIFASPIAFPPGQRFVYNSMNSYLLAALVCKTSGQSLTDYLTPRLFQPLGFGPFSWEKSPEGVEKGGWGAYMMVEDMAKLGVLYLQKGRWQTGSEMRQLLPEAWVQQATQTQIVADDGSESYGFQCWTDDATGGFIMNGMFGQYVACFPRQDIAVVMTSGSPRLFAKSTALEEMLENFGCRDDMPNSLPPAPAAHAALRQTLLGLSFRHPSPALPTPRPGRWYEGPRTGHRWVHKAPFAMQENVPIPQLPEMFFNKTWQFKPSRAGILPIIIQAINNNFTAGVKAVRFEKQAGGLVLLWEEGRGTLTLPLCFGNTVTRRRIHIGRESFLVVCRAHLRHDEDNLPVLLVEVCFLEHSSLRILKFSQKGNALLLRLDEEPQFEQALESAVSQTASTNPAAAKKPSSFTDLVVNSDYAHYRIMQLCTPSLLGTPVEEDLPDSTPPAP